MKSMKFGQSEIVPLNHTADLGIVVRSPDLPALFRDAARYMIHTMVAPVKAGAGREQRVQVDGLDLEDLMVRWLGEILYYFEGEGQVTTSVSIVEIKPRFLSAIVRLCPFDPQVHEILCEIKAVTYHQIEVARKGGRWEARIIFDL